MDSQLKQVHRRMLKVKKPLHGERSDERQTLQPRQYGATTVTQTVVATTAASSTSTPVSAITSGLPTSTAAVAGVAGFLVLILVLTVIGCLYRRRKLRSHASDKYKAPSASFDQSAMFEKKNPFAAMGLEQPLSVDLSAKITLQQSPVTPPSSASSSEESGWKSPASSTLRVKNGDRLTLLPALPKAVAEKRRPSQRGKPAWLATSAEECVGSPPPSYDIANGSAHGFLVPIPSQLPPEKGRATPTPPTPPATQKEHKLPKKERAAKLQLLVVPTHDEPAPVASPARSESFAPKDLVIPPPPPVASALPSSMPSSSSAQGFSSEMRRPRMMTVVAPYIPTLHDELRVSVGDTVRLVLEYKDGWGLVQYLGKADAPSGVVPLICLQERKRVVPTVSHKTSSGSIGSMNASGWR